MHFTKNDRLCSRKVIDELFSKGKGFSVFPFRIVYSEQLENAEVLAQVLFSVPKRNFKKAVDRNRIKRQLREIYRLNKSSFYEKLTQKNKKIVFIISFVGKEFVEFNLLDSKLKESLKKLNDVV